MRRLTPGSRIVRADGRHMEIRAVTQDGEMRVIRSSEIRQPAWTFQDAIASKLAHSNKPSLTANGHSA